MIRVADTRFVKASLFLAALACATAPAQGAEPPSASKKNQPIAATESTSRPIAEVASFSGKVSVLRSGERLGVQKGMQLFASDQLVTGPNSVAKVAFADGSSFIALAEASLEIEAYWTSTNGAKTSLNSVMNLVRGKARFFFKPREGGLDATVKTANAVMGVRGTLFFVENSQDKSTSLVVLSGQVAVHNPARPREEVQVRANEATTISLEKTPEKPVIASAEVIKKFEAQAAAIPDKEPDGKVPESLSLPPPVVPGEGLQGRLPEKMPQGITLLRQVITPQYMVVPLNSVMVTKAGTGCDRKSLDRLRQSAQSFDPETIILGRELAQCPVSASEALFWLGFYHLSQGEVARAVEAARFAKEEKIPLDLKTERERIIQNALEGNVDDLAKQVKAKNPLYARDGEGLLVLARTWARTGRYADARAIYDDYLALPRLGTDKDVQIEKGFVLLLEEKYENAESHFQEMSLKNDDENLKKSIARGFELASAHKLRPEGSEHNFVSFGFNNRGSDDKQTLKLTGATWKSHLLNAAIQTGSVSSDEKALGNFRRDILVANLGRSFRLSSGTEILGNVGFFQIGRKDLITFEGSGRYVFPFGLGVGSTFSREAALLTTALPESDLVSALQSLSLWADYREIIPGKSMLEYRFSSKTLGEDQSSMHHDATLRVAIHQSTKPRDFLLLRGRLAAETHNSASLTLSSPKSLATTAVGVEWSWGLLRWLSLESDAETALLWRETRAPETTSATLLTASKKRDQISQETQYQVRLQATVHPSPTWEIHLGGETTTASDTTPKKSWSDWRASGGVRWLYNR